MPGLVQPDFMCLCVGKKVGVKRRFFMSLGMSSGHTAKSDSQ